MKHILVAAALLMSTVAAVAQSTPAKAGANIPLLAPLEPAASGEPHTEMLDTNDSAEHDPLLEPRPLPPAGLSLIGGIARSVDKVHNRLMLQPFGGGSKYLIYFDDRTHILSAGRETTMTAIHPGDRVYVDTQMVEAHVFARTIQVRPVAALAQASGEVIEVLGGQVRLQDRLSGDTISFEISDQTKVYERGTTLSTRELRAGSLIDVVFMPGKQRGEAQSITIQASPGESYVFAGILTEVDLRNGVLALDNQANGNNYEMHFDPLSEKNVSRLTVGAPISITANFDGKRYQATSIRIGEAENTSR